jgi:hypothetical protein
LRTPAQLLELIGGEVEYTRADPARDQEGLARQFTYMVIFKGKKGFWESFQFWSFSETYQYSMAEVLESLQVQARLFHRKTYEEYCREFDESTDEPQVRANWRGFAKAHKKLRRCFGPDFQIFLKTDFQFVPPF